MDWALIIPMVIDAIMKCMENRKSSKIEAGLRNPGWREGRILFSILIDEGLRGKQLRKEHRNGIKQLKALSTAEVKGLVAQAALLRKAELAA